MGRRLAWDIETDNLLPGLTKLHLIIIRDIDSGEEFIFRADTAREGLKMLEEADFTVGHNVISFDIPALEKLYPGFTLKGQIRDTLILTRLIFSDVKEGDFLRNRKGELPGKLIGSHSLKAWGFRLGEQKAEFGEGDIDCWSEWTQAMEDYARQDVVVTLKLWKYVEAQIAKTAYSQDAIRIEHQFADLVAQIERNGFPFDEEGAKVLYSELLTRRDEIRERLTQQFRPWWKGKWVKGSNGKPQAWKEAETVTPARSIRYKSPLQADRTEGAAFCPIERVEFNPGSRDQIADRLQQLFGWKPKEFTETGKPKVSEDVLRDLVGELDADEDGIEESELDLYNRLITTVPQAKDLADFFLVAKRIGQLAEGKNGWLKLVTPEGRVHGSVNSLGAVTRRVTHARPNMSQCPAVRSPYGVEMRKLWHVPPGWVQFGTDLSGIEIRCFADALAMYDGGEYALIVVDGDVHTVNMNAFGINDRDKAKTILYALLYGAGDAKIGSIIGQGAEAGRRIRQNFMKAIPAYKKVTNALTKLVDRQGWIPALDNGRLHVRSPHKALNTSLQSAGALVAKHWSCEIENTLIDQGWRHGWDGDFAILGFFHDELQVAVRAPGVDIREYQNTTPYTDWTLASAKVNDEEALKKKIKGHKAKHLQDWYWNASPEVQIIGNTSKSAIKTVEQQFEFRCPLDCEFKVGLNWADCH
jgi:DNA polymerase-1